MFACPKQSRKTTDKGSELKIIHARTRRHFRLAFFVRFPTAHEIVAFASFKCVRQWVEEAGGRDVCCSLLNYRTDYTQFQQCYRNKFAATVKDANVINQSNEPDCNQHTKQYNKKHAFLAMHSSLKTLNSNHRTAWLDHESAEWRHRIYASS